MAYDVGFLKVSWLFSIANTDEIAITSLNFSDALPPGFDPEDALNDIDISVTGPLLLGRMFALLGGSTINWANYSQLRAVRIAAVLASGVEHDPALQYDDPTPSVGGSVNVLPQASIVLSTRSGQSSGSANFGRMYLPHTSWSLVSGSPRGNPSFIDTAASAAATFVNGCNTDLNAVVIQALQATIMTQVPGGFSKAVAEIAFGDIVDTQRRRRNALPEIYVFRSVP